MGVFTFVRRFIVANVLSMFCCIIPIFTIILTYLRHPFTNPWRQKSRVQPPASLTDRKYGVHKYVKINDIKIHYVESGNPSKPLMIFVHGFPELWYSWRHQITEFNKDYWCIAVDMRGYGDSDKPEGVCLYKIDLLVDDIKDLMSSLGRNKCVLVSHDWGGLVACRFRDVYPEALDALIMLSISSREAWLHEIWTNSKQFWMSWYVFLFRMPVLAECMFLLNDLNMFNKMFMVPGKLTVTEEDIQCYKYWFGQPGALTPPVNYYRANFEYLPKMSVHTENVPMLMALAANDVAVSSSLVDVMRTHYTHIETIIIDNIGHFMQQEDPVRVNQIIRSFLLRHKL